MYIGVQGPVCTGLGVDHGLGLIGQNGLLLSRHAYAYGYAAYVRMRTI